MGPFEPMASFDPFLDVLAKEVKEAPGWFLSILACSLLPLSLLFPGTDYLMHGLGIELEKEHAAAATIIAVTLFLLGDCLDSFCFFREKNDQRVEKFFYSVMLMLASWGLFLLLQKKWCAATIVWAFWVVMLPVDKSTLKSEKRTTGFHWLAWPFGKRLDLDKCKAGTALGLNSGIYRVSKSLAHQMKTYNPWIMCLNESAKFVRSTVIPFAVWAVWLALDHQWLWFLVLLAAAGVALKLYGSLKALHMCLLYENAAKLPGLYLFRDLPEERLRVFIGMKQPVHSKPPEYVFVASEKIER